MEAANPRQVAMVLWAVLAGAGACVAVLVLSGGAPPTLPDGIADAGQGVGWILRLSRLLALGAASLTVGALLVPAWLGCGPRGRQAAISGARRAAAVWAATSLLGYVLSVCEITGAPLPSVEATALLTAWTATAAAAHVAAALLAAAVAGGAVRDASRRRTRLLLAVALLAALPVPLAGHVSGAGEAAVPVSGLVVHVVAALVWVGGLSGLLLYVRREHRALVGAVQRYSALALGAYVALTASGLVAASAALPFTGERWVAPWASGYAAVLAAKTMLLVLLGAVGLQHRRRTLPLLAAGEPRAFLRLAAVEVVLMALGAGLAAGLSRTPVPPRDITDHAAATTHVEPLTLTALLTEWRPNAVVLLVLALALVAYLKGIARLAEAGRVWPRRRTWCFASGLFLAGVTLCSGVAAYASVLLSMHLAQLLVMLLAVAPLLLLGQPVTLARLTRGYAVPPAASRLLASPATGSIACCLLLTAVYRTPLTVVSLQSPWGHLLVLTAALASGTALLWPVLGVPERRPAWRVEQAAWLVPVLACLGVLALQLAASPQLLAGSWFLELRLGWADPVDDQRVAGAYAAVAAAVVAAVGGVWWWGRSGRPSIRRRERPDRATATPEAAPSPGGW